MVAFMIVLVLPFFHAAPPSPGRNFGEIIRARLLPPAGAPAAAAAQQFALSAGTTSTFQTALYDRIGAYQVYPQEALRQHLQRMVPVVFAMDRDGDVIKVRVKRTSGEMILDQAAVERIVRAQPLPTTPRQLPGRLTVELPIAFSTSTAPAQSVD